MSLHTYMIRMLKKAGKTSIQCQWGKGFQKTSSNSEINPTMPIT